MWYVANFLIAICSLVLPDCTFNHQSQACWELCWSKVPWNYKGDYICDLTPPRDKDGLLKNYVYDPSMPTAVLMTQYRCVDSLTGEHVTP